MPKFGVLRNPAAEPIFEELQKLCAQRDISAFLSGGALRDYFLEKIHGTKIAPTVDFDVVVSAGQHEIMAALRKKFPEFKITRHIILDGIAVVELSLPRSGLTFDFAPLRGKTSRYKKGKIDVRGALRDIAALRDFTANALFLNINNLNRPSRVYDPFNGVKAIKERIVEVTNPNIFRREQSEHSMLRAVKLAQKMNSKLSPKTIAAIRKNAQFIRNSKRYRVVRALDGILKGKNAARWVDFLNKVGLVEHIFPRMKKPTVQKVRRNLRRLRG